MNYKKYDPALFKLKRKVLNISCQDIMEICKVTRQTIRRIEQGKSRNKALIIFIGHTSDLLAEEKGEKFVKLFTIIEESNT